MNVIKLNDVVYRDNAVAVRESFAKMTHGSYWVAVTVKLLEMVGVTYTREHWDFALSGKHTGSFKDPITGTVYEVTITARQS